MMLFYFLCAVTFCKFFCSNTNNRKSITFIGGDTPHLSVDEILRGQYVCSLEQQILSGCNNDQSSDQASLTIAPAAYITPGAIIFITNKK